MTELTQRRADACRERDKYAFLPKLTGMGGVGKASYMWSKKAVTTLLLFGLLQGRSTAAGER
jgi:hypothetical protein